MEILNNKRVNTFDYTSRYSGVAYYFNTKTQRDTPGICRKLNTDTSYVLHKVTQADTLDSIALTYYNNPTYWWAIALFNKINDPFVNLALTYSTLKIPTISSLVFED